METLSSIYENLYLPSNLKIRSECTKRHYKITFRLWEQQLGRPPELTDLTDDSVLKFARWMLESKPRSPATVNQKLGYIAAIWRWCAKRRLVEYWPTFTPIPEPHIVPRAWNERQLATLHETLQQVEGKIDGIPACDWWINLHRFLWETGERIGATLKMQWDMLDRHACTVDLPPTIRKGKWRGMVYTISAELMNDLVAMRRHHHNQVFPWPHCEQTFYNRYEKILKRAGLPTSRKHKFHCMRRSFASHVQKNGGDATYLFRHSSARVTQDSYLDPAIVEDRPACTILKPLSEMRRE
ncbi:site-specific integrase [Bremerella cremea]|uniref:tyrosine-type recombinase/integrase n=1 Tax=Bremerella cremea TaxID=1031537 RepID=UPI0031E90682